MEFGKGERRLMSNLCIQIGFPEGEDGELLPYYLSGEDMTILENYPELGYLRDIVFLFKIMMAPTKETLPGLKRWEPSQARLAWHFRGDSKEESEEEEQKKKKKNKKSKNRFVVGAFDTKDLKCVAYVSDLEEDGSVGGVKSTKNKGILRGAMSAITRFFWSRSSRSPPSQADPNVCTTCLTRSYHISFTHPILFTCKKNSPRTQETRTLLILLIQKHAGTSQGEQIYSNRRGRSSYTSSS